MDCLLEQLKEGKQGLSLCQTYSGAVIHAEDLRTTGASKNSVSKQACVISNFARNSHLKLITSKLEAVRISQQAKDPETLYIANAQVSLQRPTISSC